MKARGNDIKGSWQFLHQYDAARFNEREVRAGLRAAGVQTKAIENAVTELVRQSMDAEPGELGGRKGLSGREFAEIFENHNNALQAVDASNDNLMSVMFDLVHGWFPNARTERDVETFVTANFSSKGIARNDDAWTLSDREERILRSDRLHF
jgi:hypothetical protein